MKGIEAIVAHIDADSRQECSALRQSAQRRAEELRERERQKQARFAAREHERMEEHLSQIEQSRRQLLVMERRSALLRTRQAVVEEAFAAARASLEGLDTARREKLYLKLAEAAVEPGRPGHVWCGAATDVSETASECGVLRYGRVYPALWCGGGGLHAADTFGPGTPPGERTDSDAALWCGGR